MPRPEPDPTPDERLRRALDATARADFSSALADLGAIAEGDPLAGPARAAERLVRTIANTVASKESLLADVQLQQLELEEALERAGALMRSKEDLEGKLRQSAKMEAVGRLAGGIAHDFNNLLTGIGGFADIALDQNDLSQRVRGYFEQIRHAGEKAAGLTRQLLAFSRKQMLRPQVVEIDALIGEIEAMIARLIGERVRVRFVRGGGPSPRVEVDPGQLQQVLMNLALNARDAMPDGGTLTFETEVVELDESYCQGQADARPGSFVCVAVTDTGEGMAPEVLGNAFEPFFTTKGDEGTGLGLATVHGIIRQSGGHITVYSEPGRGTTFRVYLPRVEAVSETPAARARPASASLAGDETILVTEDEDVVRGFVRTVLEQHGYRVHGVSDGAAAVRLCGDEATGKIDLLLTDVVLPGMSGPEIAARAVAIRPGLRVIYMSGYARGAIVGEGVLDPEVVLLQKPLLPRVLLETVRAVLDGPPEAAPAARIRPAPGDPEPATVLVVDDSLTARAFACEVVGEAGFEVLEAADATAALAVAAGHPGEIDLLLTDVIMPGMKGPELATRLVGERPGLKVLFMSAYTDGRVSAEELALGDFIDKPPSPAELVERIRKLLDSPS